MPVIKKLHTCIKVTFYIMKYKLLPEAPLVDFINQFWLSNETDNFYIKCYKTIYFTTLVNTGRYKLPKIQNDKQ